MKRLANAIGAHFGQVPAQVRKWRISVWLFFTAATVSMVMGMGRATFDTSIEGWFPKDDPLIVALDWFHHDFGSDDHLFVVYEPEDGDVFSEQSLETLLRLQQDLEQSVAQAREQGDSALQRVVKVTSLINAPVLRAAEEGLISEKLVGRSLPIDEARREEIRRVAQTQKTFPLLYFSKDHRFGGIMIETDFGAVPADAQTGSDISGVQAITGDLNLTPPTGGARQTRPQFQPTEMTDYVALMDEVKQILNRPEYVSHFEFHPVGSTAAAEYNLALMNELGLLNLAALLVIMVLLWFLFRSFSAVAWPIVIVVLSVIWTVGITGWMGLPVTSFVMVTVMLTLAIGVADCVHLMSGYLSARRAGEDHATAVSQSFRHVGMACLLTTVTTIVAVMALAITPIVPIKVFAFMCALGVALPLLFSVYLLPLMLDLWAPQPATAANRTWLVRLLSRSLPNASTGVSRMLEKVLPTVERRPWFFIALFTGILAVSLYGATQTRVNTDQVESFSEDSKIRQSVRLVDANMMGSQNMQIYLDLGEENAFHDPFVLQVLDELQHRIENKYQDVVVRTDSLVNTVKHSYQTLNGGGEDMYVIPATSNAVSQALFLFNLSNPRDRAKLVTDNYDRSRISVQLYNRGSYEYTEAWDGMRADIQVALSQLQREYPQATMAITGMMPLLMQGADDLTKAQLASFALALALISVILLVVFGSLKAGVIALVPNLIPAMLAYGGLGLFDRPLGIMTMMIAPVIIGIAVDDTVHFLTRYRNEVVVDGDIRRALRATIRHAGHAIVFTTLILGLGFGVFAFASEAGAADLGLFGSAAILVALLNDLFLLPAMILVFKLKFDGSTASEAKAAEAELTITNAG